MYKYFTLLVTAMLFVCLSTPLQAQLSVGGGLAFGTDVEEIAIQVRGLYGIDEDWRGEADFTFYLDGEENISFWEFNLNGNYLFTDSDEFAVYGLAGLNFFRTSVDFFNESTGNTEIGLNIGGGGQYFINEQISAFGELKFAISDVDQLLISLGVLFNLQ